MNNLADESLSDSCPPRHCKLPDLIRNYPSFASLPSPGTANTFAPKVMSEIGYMPRTFICNLVRANHLFFDLVLFDKIFDPQSEVITQPFLKSF